MGKFEDINSVQVNDIDLYYRDYGQGKPLILLHGWFGSNEFWHPYLDAFAKDYRVIVPDLRGHGRSLNLNNNDFSERQITQDIQALLDQLGIENFSGIGFSQGGMTLLRMAIQQPARVEAMILMGTAYDLTKENLANEDETPLDNIDPKFLTLMRKWHKGGDDQITTLVNLFNRRVGADDMNFSLSNLASITAKTLIILGDRDEGVPVSMALEMYRTIPKSFLWVVPNAFHILFFEIYTDIFGGTTTSGDVFPNLALEFLRGDWTT